MFRVERRPGAEITDQGVSKQLRCRREVRASSTRLEVTARRSRGLRPAAGCGRGSRLTGSALSPPANGRGGYIGDRRSISTTPILWYSPGSEGFHCPSGRTEIDRSNRENSRGARIRVGRFNGAGGGGGQAECVLQAKAKLTHGYPRERVYTQCYGEDRSVADNHNLESSLSLNGWWTGLVAIFTGTGNEDDPSWSSASLTGLIVGQKHRPSFPTDVELFHDKCCRIERAPLSLLCFNLPSHHYRLAWEPVPWTRFGALDVALRLWTAGARSRKHRSLWCSGGKQIGLWAIAYIKLVNAISVHGWWTCIYMYSVRGAEIRDTGGDGAWNVK